MANIFSSEDRILTTHAGALPRPPALLDRLLAKANDNFDAQAQEAEICAAVEACVRRQAESGIDIVADGEEKSGFVLYLQDRVSGLEPRPRGDLPGFKREFAHFLEDFERFLQRAMRKGAPVEGMPVACAGPIEYVGHDQLERDLRNLGAAAAKVPCNAAFMASIAPSAIGTNEYYPSDAAFLEAAGEALRSEYEAIVEAGFLLQIDDPFLPTLFSDPEQTPAEADRRARDYVDALNHSLRGIPAAKVRYHICCGAEAAGPNRRPFVDVARHMLRVNAAAYSFEASNHRHEDDDELWRVIRLPDGKVIMPLLATSCGDKAEAAEEISERLVRFAGRVGRDNVIASVDSRVGRAGLSLRKSDPAPVWARFEAVRNGAERASRRLWA